MAKKILVIPDVHGETFWEKPVQKYLGQVDRVVFLGDYLDPYWSHLEEYDFDAVYSNMMEIVDLKQNYNDKVILLKGNHDFHYCSKRAMEIACASRCDKQNWDKFNRIFTEYESFFKIAHLEIVKDITYLFSHAGFTTYWLNMVNAKFWRMNDRDISVDSPQIIDMINELEHDSEGQNLLSVVGRYRTILGERTGSVIWADAEEHAIPKAPKAYGLNKVFQVFGHTRLNKEKADKIEFENFAMIDSQQCFIIDENVKENIMSIKDYEIWQSEKKIVTLHPN